MSSRRNRTQLILSDKHISDHGIYKTNLWPRYWTKMVWYGMVWTTWKGVPIAQLAGDCEPNRCFRMFQNAIQKAREMGKLEMNFDFDTSTAVLDCEQANTKRTKLSALMYWVKKLHESPPEPLKCDYMSECQKCTFIPIYTSSTYALP